jgi:heme oxygenase (staphylobilin-producing)
MIIIIVYNIGRTKNTVLIGEGYMFVQVKKITVTEGNSAQVVDRFSKPGIIEEQEGFIDATVMLKKVRRGEEEVMIQIRWKSEEYWKQWEKSEAHIAGHKANRGKPKPDYIVNSEGGLYNVVNVKEAKVKENIEG